MATTCSKCGGTGFEVRTDSSGVSRAARCDCSFLDQGDRLLKIARIPRRYEDRTFDGFGLNPNYPSLEKALVYARDWVARWPEVDNRGILFHGGPGTGKTHLAVAILVELATGKGARVLFYEQRELFKALQGTFSPNSPQSESAVLAPVLGAEVLVLDDLGAGRTTQWGREVLHEVISHRYNHGLPLILTTNCVLGTEDAGADGADAVLGNLTLDQRLGDSLMSRLFEMCRIIKLEGKDFRKQAYSAEFHGR